MDGLVALKYWEIGNLRVTQYKVSSGLQYCDLSLSNGDFHDGYVTIGLADTAPHQALVVYTDDRLIRRAAGALMIEIQIDDNDPFVTTLTHESIQYATAWANRPATDFEPLMRQLAVGQTLTLSLVAPSVRSVIPLKGVTTKIRSWRQCLNTIAAGHMALPRTTDLPSVQQQTQTRPYQFTPSPALPATVTKPRVEIPLRKSQGGFNVDAILNGTTRASFIIDSGATNVTIPRNVIAAMIDAGTITKADYAGQQTYTFANGSEQRLHVVRLKSLTVGGRTIENILCAVGDDPRVFLLGQSFLSKLKSWSIDNARGVLILED
jgi:clan AA aspartic protease (TIGR02281 family)